MAEPMIIAQLLEADAVRHTIPTWFLVLGLFLPRLTLVAAYITHTVPANNVPFLLDVLGTLILPRVLICIYIATNMGYNEWFWTHLVVALLVYGVGSNKGKKALREAKG
jgi:predicted ferric reductase